MKNFKLDAELSVKDTVGESTKEDLADRLKSHYEYVSSISHEWSNQVDKAIDFYCENKTRIEELEERIVFYENVMNKAEGIASKREEQLKKANEIIDHCYNILVRNDACDLNTVGNPLKDYKEKYE